MIILISIGICELLAFIAAGDSPIAGTVYLVMGVIGLLVGAAITDAEKHTTS